MINVLMCGSTLKTKGGMVSVIKNYLGYPNWDPYKISLVPTHFDTKKYLLVLFFGVQVVKIIVKCIFGKYKIAHLHTASRGSFWRKSFLLKLFQCFGMKVVLHHHGGKFDIFYNDCSEHQKAKIRATLAAADMNIVLSKRLVSVVKDKAPDAKIEVLYNAVQTFPQNPYDTSRRGVLFLGRLGKGKGTYDLLNAIKRLDASIPSDIVFYFCGDGEIDAVRRKVAELGIEHRVAHIGWIDGTLKEEILQKVFVNVLPSYNEALPMSILETMARGIPNISTNIASIPEVIKDGENGFLIEPGDIDALTDRIRTLVLDSSLRSLFSKASYELVTENFSLDANIDKLKMVYQKL